jgi:hypothetical protein
MHNRSCYLAAALGALAMMPEVWAGVPLQEVMSDPTSAAVARVAHKSSHRPTIHVTGVITDEGVECTAMRDDNGRLYTLAGRVGGLKSGDRVRVTGRIAQASFCMQGTTIEVRKIVAAR